MGGIWFEKVSKQLFFLHFAFNQQTTSLSLPLPTVLAGD